MKRYLAVLSVAAVLSAGMFAAATAQVGGTSPIAQLRRRVSALEDRADRQRRTIVELREQSSAQQEDIELLLAFRTSTNNSIQYLMDRASQLEPDGDYIGPIAASQVTTTACENEDAVWEDSSLGCRGRDE